MSKIKRRNFIANTLKAGVAASLLNLDTTSAQEKAMDQGRIRSAEKPKRSVVGGAGIAGLCCAYELMKLGHEVMVREASGRHGGHVYTAHDGLSDGLYGDYGQEQITRPGYDRYWEYIREFGLTALPYPRRKNTLRRINGRFYSEEDLQDREVLKSLGYNDKEVVFLATHPWGELKRMYLEPYFTKIKDEYQPFGNGMDELDAIPASDIYEKAGASGAALARLGGKNSSALFEIWMSAILYIRGVPEYPTEIFRLKGGNQMLPNAFARRLGERVLLGRPITSIEQEASGVTVTYLENEQEKKTKADHYVNCIPFPAFKDVQVQPEFSPEMQYVINHVEYDSYQRFVFQASSRFWEKDGISINLFLDHPDLWEVWQSADEVDTHRVIVLGTGPGGISPQRALAAFRELYPGSGDTIEQAVSRDWTKQRYSPTCERLPFPIGELKRFWPQIMKAQGRIHFAGAYADNLNWGTEAATRSANRVAREIDET
jgi:monoamine oxidase